MGKPGSPSPVLGAVGQLAAAAGSRTPPASPVSLTSLSPVVRARAAPPSHSHHWFDGPSVCPAERPARLELTVWLEGFQELEERSWGSERLGQHQGRGSRSQNLRGQAWTGGREAREHAGAVVSEMRLRCRAHAGVGVWAGLKSHLASPGPPCGPPGRTLASPTRVRRRIPVGSRALVHLLGPHNSPAWGSILIPTSAIN